MTKEYDTIKEAKHSLKAHIEFFENLLQHLKGPDKILRNRAVWATWCLHRYINDRLMQDIETAIVNHAPKGDAHVQ